MTSYIPHRAVLKCDDDREFFRRVLAFMSLLLPEKKRLTASEREVLVYILAQPDHNGDGSIRKNYFAGTPRKMLQRALNIRTQTFSHYIKELVDKEWIRRTYKDDGSREYHYDASLLALRKLYFTTDHEGMHMNIFIKSGKHVS